MTNLSQCEILQDLQVELLGRDGSSDLLPEDLQRVADALGVDVAAVVGDEEAPTVATALSHLGVLQTVAEIEKDMDALPLAEGDRLPSLEYRTQVCEAFENNPALDSLMDEVFDRLADEGMNSIAEFYNAYKVPTDSLVDFIWNGLTADDRMNAALDLVASTVPTLGAEQTKLNLRNKLTNRPYEGLNAKGEGWVLSAMIGTRLSKAFSRTLMKRMRAEPFPLLKNGETLQDVETFCTGLEVAMNFEGMDRISYYEMLDNDLGQAQTANHGAAENYFRSRENLGDEVHNNFGYVYLNRSQTEALNIGEEDAARPFRYMGSDFFAVPVGLYFAKKCPESYNTALRQLEHLASAYPGTPAEEYYRHLIAYYELGVSSPLRGEDFLKAYYEQCYEAERSWVRYVRFAAEAKLPSIHIHPFERYATPSTKSHELPLALVNPAETEILLATKARYAAGAHRFMESSGVLDEYPIMAEQSLQQVGSAAMISLAARMHSVLPGALAQNVPDEEPGKRDGIASLFDMAFAARTSPVYRGVFLRDRDGLGGISRFFEEMARDPKGFMAQYLLFVGGHELNHNMYKGQKRSTTGTGDGLSLSTIEEAKASNGMGLMFEDAQQLKPAEIEELRLGLGHIIPWMLTRLNATWLSNHRSAPYLREGSVLMDHMIKSGLLQVRRMKVRADQVEECPLQGEVAEDEFESLAFHLSDAAIQDFVLRCHDFMKRLAPDYYTAEFTDVSPDHVIPDWTRIDTWQALSRACYDRDMKRAKDDVTVEAIQAEKDKVTPPLDPAIAETVAALLRFADKEQGAQIRRALKTARWATDETMESFLADLKEEVQVSYPQVTQ